MSEIIQFFKIIFDIPYVLQTLSVALAISIVYKEKITDKKSVLFEILKCLSVFSLIVAVNLLLFIPGKYIRLSGFGMWMPYLAGIVLYAIAYCRFDGKVKLVYGGAALALTLIVAQSGTVIGNALSEKIEGFPILATKIASDVLILFFAFLFRKNSIVKYEINSTHMILNLSANVLSSVVIIVYDVVNRRIFSRDFTFDFFLAYSVILICLYLINLITYFMTFSLCRERNSVLQLQTEKEKSKAINELISVSEHSLEELSEVRHELKNQYAYMRQMLVQKQYDKLQAFFEEMTGTFAKPLYRAVDCGNQSLNAIMNMEYSKAEAHGIKTEIQLVVPHKLPFADSDIFSVCTNLIDNAIESCLRDGLSGTIKITANTVGDYLKISVENPLKEKKVDPSITVKKDKKHHGYGIRIIKRLVKKYDGMYYYKAENGLYVSEVFLDMKEREAA